MCIIKHLLVFTLTAILSAHAMSTHEQSSIDPASLYRQDGVIVVSPNQPGWILIRSDKSETVFEKQAADEILCASVKTIKTKTFDADKDLLISLEALKQEELNKLKRDSVHFNYVRFKGSPCLQYDGIFKLNGTTSPRYEYFNLKGYLCPHPQMKGLAVQIEFSSRSNSRGFSENLVPLYDEFFNKIEFSKAAVR
jgi:hypothetical protein